MWAFERAFSTPLPLSYKQKQGGEETSFYSTFLPSKSRGNGAEDVCVMDFQKLHFVMFQKNVHARTSVPSFNSMPISRNALLPIFVERPTKVMWVL